MTDEELLKRLLALFAVFGGNAYYIYKENLPIGEIDAELEPHLIARLMVRAPLDI